VSVDYNQLELCALSQVLLNLFGSSRMAAAIQAGQDLHLAFAAQLLDISYAEAERRKKDSDVKKARQFGKIFNFGRPGGLGARTLVEFARLQYGVVMTEDEAREYGETWFETFPEMREYFAYVSNLVGDGDATIESFGSGMVRGGAGYTDTCNHFFQNLAAQGAKEAVYRVAKECYLDLGTALYGCRPVAFIHDEILAEVPRDTAHEAAFRLAEVMKATMAEYIPDIPISATPALMARWFKEATDMYAEGRLVPWIPTIASAA
jgi:DNA polymerase-1